MVPVIARGRRGGIEVVRACLLLAGLAGLAGVLGGLGCGAATPKLESGVYRGNGVAFRVGDVPPRWREVKVEGATIAYRDDDHRASILLDARCNRKDDDVPLLALTDHLVMGTTERDYAAQDTVPFDGREAMHSRLRAKLDGVPRDYDIFVLKKDGCVYDFVYVAEPEPSTDGGAFGGEGAATFDRFVGTFHTLPGSGTGSGTETRTST
jgi:hypothetical protein